MAGIKLDGAGVQKLRTLDDAGVLVQRLHGIVETYALALKRSQPTSIYPMQVKRALAPIVTLLKPQFGAIADQAGALNLVAGRGGLEQIKIRLLREGIGSIRQSLEIAATRAREHHAIRGTAAEAADGAGDDTTAPETTADPASAHAEASRIDAPDAPGPASGRTPTQS